MSRRNKILFVDDEQQVLHGLRLSLRPLRKDWDFEFANDAVSAQTLIEKSRFDVVVSDMVMPDMNGAQFLNYVKERSPRSIRIILSGQTEMKVAMNSVSVAHQFLSKPCESERLKATISRVSSLLSLLESESVKTMVGKIGTLPPIPSNFSALTDALANPNVPLHRLARIIEKDMALTAKVLQIVNSAYFGLSRTVADVGQAIALLGISTIRSLVLSEEAFSKFGRVSTLEVKRIQEHAFVVAKVAKKLLDGGARGELAFTAGLLHDIGSLATLCSDDRPSDDNVDQAVVGAYLLGVWGLPGPVVEAVAFCGAPDQIDHQEMDVVDAVHLANYFVSSVGESSDKEPPLERPAEDYLARIGVTPDRFEELSSIATQTVADQL